MKGDNALFYFFSFSSSLIEKLLDYYVTENKLDLKHNIGCVAAYACNYIYMSFEVYYTENIHRYFSYQNIREKMRCVVAVVVADIVIFLFYK